MGQIYGLKLTPAKREILLAMAENADDAGSNCKPGVPFIAWKVGLSERQVQRVQKALITDGILVIVEKPVRKPVVYRIDISAGTAKEPFKTREQRKGDILSTNDGDNLSSSQGDILSENGLRVTSHGKGENAKGDIASANLASTHLKDEPKEKDKGRNAPAREVTPAQVGFIQEHPVWQAFVRGWDGITPALEEKAVDTTLTAIQVLYADITGGETSLEEIETVTRWKIQQPRSHGYRLEYVKADTPAYRASKRAQSGNGKHAPVANNKPPPPPVLTPTSQGVPLSLARREKDRARTS